jgi:hypothetical protein
VRWYRIPTPRISQPSSGSYNDWKAQLADEGRYQCVYCAIPEASWGGFRNFHVEHYRPKNRFAALLNNIENLFYCCAVCNSFKREDWPSEPTDALDEPCYPLPSAVDYNDIFSVSPKGELAGENAAARYVAERLYLNRPHLLLERREAMLESRFVATVARLNALTDELIKEGKLVPPVVLSALYRSIQLLVQRRQVRPYTPEQLKRPKTTRGRKKK